MNRMILFGLCLLFISLTACGDRIQVHHASSDYESTTMSDQNPYFLEQEMKYGDLFVRGTIDSVEETYKRGSGIKNSKVNLDYDVTPAIVKIDKVFYGKRPTSNTITLLQHGSSSSPIDSADFVKKGDDVILLLMKTPDGVYWTFNGLNGTWFVKDGVVTSRAVEGLMLSFNNSRVEEFEQIITTAARNSHHKDPAKRFADVLRLLSDSNIVLFNRALTMMSGEYPNSIYAYKSQVVNSIVLLAEKRASETLSESWEKGKKLGKAATDEMKMRMKDIDNYLPNNSISVSPTESTDSTMEYVIHHFDMAKTKEKVEELDWAEKTLVNPLQAYEKDGITVPKMEEVIPYIYAFSIEEFKRIYHSYLQDGEFDYARYFNDYTNVLKENNSPLAEECQKIADELAQAQ